MRLIILILLSYIVFANGSEVKDVNIDDREDILEIVFSLSGGFDGQLSRNDDDGFSTFVLKNTQYPISKIIKSTSLIHQVEVFKKNNDVYLLLIDDDIATRFKITASSTPNSLRVSVVPVRSITTKLIEDTSLESAIGSIKNQALSNPTLSPQNNGIEIWRYSLVVGILLVLLIALVIVKKKMYKSQNTNFPFPYFKKPSLNITQTIPIDSKNKILILESRDCKYMLFIGEKGSFIIDKVENNNFEKDIDKLIKSSPGNKLSYFLKAYENERSKNT